MRLKKKIEELEERLVSVVALIKIVMPADLNAYVEGLISAPGKEMKIVASEVDPFYADLIVKAVKGGKKTKIVTREWTKMRGASAKGKSAAPVSPNLGAFDKLKNTVGVDVVEYPKVSQLIILLENKAFYSAGALDRDVLVKSNQIGFEIAERGAIKQVQEVLQGYMPSFMR
jgi:hypothetical protein